jgi:rod shape-determining protein MreC
MKSALLDRSNEYLISHREYFTLFAAVVAAIAILFNNDAPQIDALRGLAIDRLAFFQEKMRWVSHWSQSAERMSALRERATQLMLENSQLREAYLENFRLRRLLDYRQRSPLQFRSCRVLFAERSRTPNTVVIDLGKEHGMKENMPVVTPEGLAGKIYKVHMRTSLVQLMLDRNFSVSSRAQGGRVLGIVSWSDTRGLEMTGVPRNAVIKPGDVVVTSDYSALYPPGLRIGTVLQPSLEKGEPFMRIPLDPAVQFDSLEELFVIITPAESFKVNMADSSRGE